MLNHCFSLLNYFKLGISFFKEIRVVNSHIRYCLIFKFLVGFYKLRLSFRQRWVCFANSLSYLLGLLNSYWKDVLRGRPSLSVTAWLLYHVVFCLSSTFFKVFWDFFRSETLLSKFSVNSSKLPHSHWRMIQFSRFSVFRLTFVSRDSFVIIPPSQAFVNIFFSIRKVAYFSRITE